MRAVGLFEEGAEVPCIARELRVSEKSVSASWIPCSAGGSRHCSTGTTSSADSSPGPASLSTDRTDPGTPKSVIGPSCAWSWTGAMSRPEGLRLSVKSRDSVT
ncbi:hypothetical protein ACIRU3_45800 [Streptomyces sp. NPDC101151]|uniref:hypothetical protein n=1 Tax=Streptomyces sp. NPDC101151 TaxID=3366115 RepID=UPI00380928C2